MTLRDLHCTVCRHSCVVRGSRIVPRCPWVPPALTGRFSVKMVRGLHSGFIRSSSSPGMYRKRYSSLSNPMRASVPPVCHRTPCCGASCQAPWLAAARQQRGPLSVWQRGRDAASPPRLGAARGRPAGGAEEGGQPPRPPTPCPRACVSPTATGAQRRLPPTRLPASAVGCHRPLRTRAPLPVRGGRAR